MNHLGLLRALAVCFSLLLTVAQTVDANAVRHARRAAKRMARAGHRTDSSLPLLTRTPRNLRHLNLETKVQAGAFAARIGRHGPLTPLPWDPELKIREIMKVSPTPKLFLPKIWEIQQKYGDHDLIALTAKRYYKEYFYVLTPHLFNLFNKISSFQKPHLERRFLTRMQFLVENKQFIIPKLAGYCAQRGDLRIRYLSDIGKLTPQNFQEKDLVLSVEQKMLSVGTEKLAVRHVNLNTTFQVGPNFYQVYQYMGPVEYMPNLYRFLLNGDNPRAPITMVFDEKNKSLAMYNRDKTLWIRVTPHEYESPKKLHIHLNELRTVTFIDNLGAERTETVNFNLSIPLAVPDNMPLKQPKTQQFLYEKLVLHPVKNLQGDKNVTIERRPIF